MKPIKPLLFMAFLLPFFVVNAFAKDTDIYAARGQGVEPNILIIFDNSQSMSETVPCDPIPTKIYQKTCPQMGGCYWVEYATDIDAAIQKLGSKVCPAVRTNLTNPGYHNGYTTKNNQGTCNKNSMELATGDYLNNHQALTYCPKIDVAQKTITDFLTNINDVRVGVMIFNSQGCEKDATGAPICNQGTTRDTHGNCRTNYPNTGCKNTSEYEGGHILSFIDSISNNRATLISNINAITASTYTPLAETLYEAGLYYKGANTIFNMDTTGTYPNNFPKYVSPIQFSCQKNYVIIITDGKSTMDHNTVLNTLAHNGDYDNKGEDPYGPSPCSSHNNCYDSGGTDYLNDVAKYLFDTQEISTYTIGFAIDYDLLKRTAEEGNGHYYTANDAQQLVGAFLNVIDEILSKSTSFVAPIVPVSRLEKTTAGDKIYLALFKPKNNKMWSGNVKMYGVAQTNNPGQHYYIGDILDRNNMKAVDSNGQFIEGSISYWNTDQDGGEVEKGGTGEVLLKRDLDTRQIYTFFKSSGTLNLYGNNNNAFTTTNPLITTGVLNLMAGSKDDLINFVYGFDAYQDESSDETKTRSWILGSFLHSRPFLIHYGPSINKKNIVFAGANDGMLHAFDDLAGTELWGFIPTDLLGNLQYLHSDSNLSFVDGSPKAYVNYDSNSNPDQAEVTSAILIFGERRGGNRYYAIDVTNPNTPQFLWYISPTERVYKTTTYTTTDYQELGQSWSTPIIGKIACNTGATCINGAKVVAFIGGGYDDTNEDKGVGTVEDPYTTVADSKGRAIYVVDIADGSLVKRFSNAEKSDMTYSISSDIATLDLNGDGLVERLYVGDMAGRMWRFDIANTDPSLWTGKIIFKSNPDGATTNLRKIFYPPDVTLEADGNGNYEMLFFGTGDREHPNDKTIVNRLYAVKDRNPSAAYSEDDLYDATADLLQTGTADQKTTALSQLNAKSGWFIQLDSTLGEKSLAPPIVFYKVAYFTTFAPSSDAPPPGTDPCYVGEGLAYLYAVNYKTGNAVFNLDYSEDTTLSKTDRSELIGTAIPSGVIITIVQGRAAAYSGMGGGVVTSNNSGTPCDPKVDPKCKEIPLGNTNSSVPVNWKVVF